MLVNDKNFMMWVSKLNTLCKKLDSTINIMTLCGTHENTVARYGIRSILPSKINLIPGPGCPVCVLPDEEIQKALHLLNNKDVVLTTFGDMARVPYNGTSLLSMKTKGHDVRIVYSIFDSVRLAEKIDRPVVHLAIGFETTMPSTALAILDEPSNFYVLCAHRFFVPAVEHLLECGVNMHGFINPGHVSAIVGVKAYEDVARKYRIPQVIAGFEPADVMEALCMLVEMILEGAYEVRNQYTRVVSYDGNVNAQIAINEVFERKDGSWRGLGIVKKSGAKLKRLFDTHDAEIAFEEIFEDFVPEEDPRKKVCKCGGVLRGLSLPTDCPLFMKSCTPRDPVGPCMVSIEGACNLWASYGLGFTELPKK